MSYAPGALALLNQVLRQQQVELIAELKAIFLTGYLEKASKIKVLLADFDAAAAVFCRAADVDIEVWCTFLDTLGGPMDREAMEGTGWAAQYFTAEVLQFKATMATAAPPRAASEVVEKLLEVSQADWVAMEAWLQIHRQLETFGRYETIRSWQVLIPDAILEVIRVDLVNADGGPALVPMHIAGARCVKSLQPSYDRLAKFEFLRGDKLYSVRFLATAN